MDGRCQARRDDKSVGKRHYQQTSRENHGQFSDQVYIVAGGGRHTNATDADGAWSTHIFAGHRLTSITLHRSHVSRSTTRNQHRAAHRRDGERDEEKAK